MIKDKTFRPKGGESSEDVNNRARTFLTNSLIQDVDLEQEFPNVLVVSHGGLIRQLFFILFNEMGCKLPPTTSADNQELFSAFLNARKSITNTSWFQFELDISNDTTKIENLRCIVFHQTDHLNILH